MIYEYRTYIVIPGMAEALIARMHEFFSVVEKCGGKIIAGIFQTVIGDSNEISYILGYDDLAHRQRAWQSMIEDEDMKKIRQRWTKEDPCSYNIFNKILKSTEYSASK